MDKSTLILEVKDDIKKMTAINKEEKDAIARRFPRAHIVRTMKQKSKRHRYWVEENRRVVEYLNRIRESSVVSSSE